MDAKEFEKEIIEKLRTSAIGTTFESWQDYRQEIIIALYTTVGRSTRSPDYLTLQAALALNAGGLESLDTVVPEFRNKLNQYRRLQAELIIQLQTIQNELLRTASLFRAYL